MFSEYTMVYWQDLKLGPYFMKWQLATDRGLPKFPINYFAKLFKRPKFLKWSKFPRIHDIL